MYSVLQVYKIKMGYCRYTLVNKQILWTLYCRFITEGWVLQIYTSKQTNIMYYVLQVYKSRMGYCRYTLVNKQILCTMYCRFTKAGWGTADIH